MSIDGHLRQDKQLVNSEVDNLINEASNPENYANKDLEIPESNIDKFMSKLSKAG